MPQAKTTRRRRKARVMPKPNPELPLYERIGRVLQDETMLIAEVEKFVFTKRELSNFERLHREVVDTLCLSQRTVLDNRTGKRWRVPRFIVVTPGYYRVATRQDMTEEVLKLCSIAEPEEPLPRGAAALRSLVRACRWFSTQHVRARFNQGIQHGDRPNVTPAGKTFSPMVALDRYDNAARREITLAKRAEVIRVNDSVAYFNLRVQGTLPSEIQTLLRSLVNLRKHGKAYAPEAVDGAFTETHHRIANGREFNLSVRFDLDTGEMTIDLGQ